MDKTLFRQHIQAAVQARIQLHKEMAAIMAILPGYARYKCVENEIGHAAQTILDNRRSLDDTIDRAVICVQTNL